MAHRGLIRDAPQVWPPISLNDSCHAGPWIRRRCRAPNDSGSRTTSTLSYDVGRRKISYKDEFNEKSVKIYRYQNFTNLKRQKTFSMTSTLWNCLNKSRTAAAIFAECFIDEKNGNLTKKHANKQKTTTKQKLQHMNAWKVMKCVLKSWNETYLCIPAM